MFWKIMLVYLMCSWTVAGAGNRVGSHGKLTRFWAQELMPGHANPLIRGSALPPFTEITHEHVGEAVDYLKEFVRLKLEQIENDPDDSFTALYKPLEKISVYIQKIWSPVEHLRYVNDNPQLREVFAKAEPQMVKLRLQVEQNSAVYHKLLSLNANENLTAVQRRIVELKLRGARLAGVGLQDEKKERFITISEELKQLAIQFENNNLDAIKDFTLVLKTQDDIAGLPESFLRLAAQNYSKKFKKEIGAETGPWLVTLDFPSYSPFMRYSERRDLREKLYRTYVTVAATEPFNNTEVIRKMLQLRKKEASILGFANYAEMQLEKRMAKNTAEINTLLDELHRACYTQAEKDYSFLSAYAQKHGCNTPLAHWDISLWTRKLREEQLSLNEDELRQYFPFPQVMTGMFNLAKKLFAIEIKEHTAQKWHPDVSFYQVYNEANEHIASFYVDPYNRQDKRSGAWKENAVLRREANGVVKDIPVVYIVSNFSPPVDGEPSLLNSREVITTFHEFGHAIHAMLTTVGHAEVAGTSGVERDAVELPSKFMENFVYLEQVIADISRHVDTGENLPAEMLDQLQASRNFFIASEILRQVFLSRIDLELHENFDPDSNADFYALMHRVAEETQVMPLIPEDKFLNNFLHLFSSDYAVGYYGYKWSEVLAADAFALFKKHGFSDTQLREMGQRYLDTILAAGGSAHPAELFKKFRGRDQTIQALLEDYGLVVQK